MKSCFLGLRNLPGRQSRWGTKQIPGCRLSQTVFLFSKDLLLDPKSDSNIQCHIIASIPFTLCHITVKNSMHLIGIVCDREQKVAHNCKVEGKQLFPTLNLKGTFWISILLQSMLCRHQQFFDIYRFPNPHWTKANPHSMMSLTPCFSLKIWGALYYVLLLSPTNIHSILFHFIYKAL